MENKGLLHRCGQCLQLFETEDLYRTHVCPTTGVAPTHPASMGDNYLEIQAAALKRGADVARANGDHETADRTEKHIEEIKAGHS